MPIAMIYAALLGLFFVFLSVRTIRLRLKLKVALGHGDQPLLMKAIRAHANFAEYVPLSLLLIYFFESQVGGSGWTHLLCVVLVAGRLVHAYGLSQLEEDQRYRVAGMTLTFAVIVSASLGLLFEYAKSLGFF